MRSSRRSAAVAVALLAAVVPISTASAANPVRVTARAVAAPLSSRAAKTTITVRNTGRARLRGMTLAVGPAKGLKVAVAGARRGRSSRPLPPLRGGASARVTVTLKRGRGGPSKGSVRVTVQRGGRALARTTLRFGAGSGRSTRPAPPPVDPNTLAGRLYWGSQYSISGILQHTLYFIDKSWVWVGDLEGGWPTCTAVTDDCKNYAYDAAARALTIDGRAARLDGLALEHDGDNYREFGFPPASSRWDTVVTYSNSSGVCPLYCTYFTEYLTFRPDGTFIRSGVVSGSGPVIDFGIVPPDSKGTYEVRADRTLLLAFADGRQRLETVALYVADDGRSLDPPGRGLLLNSDGYFDIRD